jgi:hypothetical protein
MRPGSSRPEVGGPFQPAGTSFMLVTTEGPNADEKFPC